MKKLNLIVVFNSNLDKVLFALEQKNHIKGFIILWVVK